MNMIEAVSKLRNFIKDKEALNTVLEAEENTNTELEDYITDALDAINNLTPPVTHWTIEDVPS
jgi:bifunctional N-acetylglucosamine-1-phosphate-uridyltransferase/glucosamine-1-phosphate-acetyltransferase GlmU-like protein